MDVFHAANKYSLKLIFSFLEYCDILRFLGSSHIIYDSLINETRQITISFKGLLKLLLDQSFFMKRIVDPSKQLSIIFASRGKESLMQGVKSSFPYFLLNPEVNFPSLFKLSSVPTFFLYLCEGYQCFTVRKLEILHDLDVNLSDYLSRHMIRVLEELVLPSWPIEVPFPQLAPTLQSLSVRRSAINALPPLPHLKRLYLKDCDNTDLDFTAYNLEALELINPRVLDFDKISSCARLVVHSPKEVKNIPNAKKFRQIEFADITIKNLPKESLQQVRELRLYYLRESEDVPLNLSSFTNLERFTLNSYHGKGIGLRFNPRAPSHLKVVHISLFGNAMNLSWFTNVHEIKLDFCAQVASLVGLEKVPRVILRDLDFLKSLNGLGKNDYVEVYDCASVKDFSAVKFVREVKIEECEKFRNSSDVAYVQKLIIISCEALIDLSGLVEVKELYLSHCDSVRYCEALKRITKLRISRCWKLRQSNLMQLNNFGGTIGAQDKLSSLTDCLHFEILKYLLQKEIREVISCNTHVYQRCIGRMHFPSPMSEDESKDKSNNVSFFPDSYHYTISWTIFESGEVQIPSFVQTLKFCFCKFSCSPNLIERLKRLEFYKCKGLSNIINFNIADEVIIEQGSSNNSLNLALLNQVKRLTLEDYYIKDYSPLQDIEEITVNYRLGRCNRAFQGSQAFSNTKKIKLYFKFLIDIEIDLAFYQKVEIFHLSGGDFNCNRPCPPTLRVLRLSILRKLTLPAGLDHLHQLHIADCRGFSSLQGLGSIPNIRLSALSDLKSLEGLGPGNEFVQLIDLDKVEDFSPVSGCRKVVIWDCLKFKDAPAFAESNYLVIGECDNLVDVSMLGKVKHLELIDCENIWSLKGLEGVKELIVSDCRLLEDQNNTRHRPWTVSEGY